MSNRGRCAARGVLLASDSWGGTQLRVEAPDDSVGPPAYRRARAPTRLRVPA